MTIGNIIFNSIQCKNVAPIYSHTLENKSSFAANPPEAGLLPLVLVVVLLTGAALVHPPKSSSGATVAAEVVVVVVVAAGAPQPAPMSREVKVSGIFIESVMEGCADVVCFAAGGARVGAGSGVLQAFPPHGSMLDEENMLVTFDVEVVGAAFWAC